MAASVPAFRPFVRRPALRGAPRAALPGFALPARPERFLVASRGPFGGRGRGGIRPGVRCCWRVDFAGFALPARAPSHDPLWSALLFGPNRFR